MEELKVKKKIKFPNLYGVDVGGTTMVMEEKEFFASSELDLKLFEEAIEKNLADAVVEIDGLEDDEIVAKIIDKIKEYYSVN